MASAHEEIRNLLGRYCERMDAGRFDELAELFQEAAMVNEDGSPIARGFDEVQALYAKGTQLYDGSPRTRHITANSIVEVDEESGKATARSSYVVFQGTDALPLQPIITGRYRDEFVRTSSGRWQFSERRFYVDQVGDLSQHLTYPIPG